MVRANPALSKMSAHELVQPALSSPDGMFIQEAVNRLEGSTLPKDEQQRVFNLLAKTHADKTIVVIRCLSALARLHAPQLRPLCRNLINAPFDPDHDNVVSHAITLLASIKDPERVDMLLLAKGVDHPCIAIKHAARQAVERLPKELRAPLLALARDALVMPPSHAKRPAKER
jgi:hypothetical protein